MIDVLTQFHFLRPYCLLAFIPCLLVFLLVRRQHHHQGSWRHVIAPPLLPHLIQGEHGDSTKRPLSLVSIAWILACIALAGPTWKKIPMPVNKSLEALVVVIDVSHKMYASDVSPNRYSRIRYKLRDLFQYRQNGISALVAYAGSAHVIAPLTDDARTLENLVNAISPDIMPVQGDNPTAGIEEAVKLLKHGAGEAGDILLITDSIPKKHVDIIEKIVNKGGHRLSIIGIGSDQGAPISLPKGGFMKDSNGAIIIPQRKRTQLTALATRTGGHYANLTVDDNDLQAVLPKRDLKENTVQVERSFDQWHDMGYWLVLLLLPITLAGFRKGWLVALCAVTILPTYRAEAFGWDDLWKTPDQQAMERLKDNPSGAAHQFQRSDWKAEALYQSEQYEAAANAFEKSSTASGDYNRANALAKAGKLDEALDAYASALEKNPSMDDARENRKIVEELKKQQEQTRTKNSQTQNDQDKSQEQNQNEKGNSEQPSEQQSGDQQNNPQSSDSGRQRQSDQQPSEGLEEIQPNTKTQDESESSQYKNQQQPEHSDTNSPEKTEQDNETASRMEQSIEQVNNPEQQAMENWLNTIPDDISGLLRRKFRYQQQLKEQRRQRDSTWLTD